MNEKIILSLGSNVGDRKENINAALSGLMSSGFDADSVSSYYETEPVGLKEQDDFVNIAVSGTFEGDPEQLIGVIGTIESDLGRVREIKYGPRTIDIDIILFGERKIDTEDLKIPHTEFRNRKFVLVPVCEIEPDAQDPVTGKTVSVLLSECADSSKVSKMSMK
ncbi:MAG: 2-amino-4-hydroxy-6-hydroxymethyldihydropteridine diphosphokinase [Candidatus Delongbacteria bacterium]|jgi:2-amino-4-hydroxy-6-hydroxymethyldihydropteridine diphosphokinase|nr:2-amino-4-hydroxy-6-hydroxymethyldihydropteridine diphosphokinase [Candidatus Delongbacteria bacterium]MDD4205123.1 2-amino-4-hydroxy-6-hydroxymethyldihydropteridine diphosphokinase [Candidatus Delongbacteria bacterium]MDY0017384.1 2-amino-4-hydroxy-6-hydroxymethyldihydropteridine diphosphokinase [Candidatus Delongbacteria bacterium]